MFLVYCLSLIIVVAVHLNYCCKNKKKDNLNRVLFFFNLKRKHFLSFKLAKATEKQENNKLFQNVNQIALVLKTD